MYYKSNLISPLGSEPKELYVKMLHGQQQEGSGICVSPEEIFNAEVRCEIRLLCQQTNISDCLEWRHPLPLW